MGCYDYGLLFRRAINDNVVGLVEFYRQGLYNLTEYPDRWITDYSNIFRSNLWDLSHSALLAGKFKHHMPNDDISPEKLIIEICRIAKLVNSNDFSIMGYELIACPVVFSKELSTENFPYYKKQQKFNAGWTHAFLNDKLFNFKGFKTLGFTSMFSCDQEILDVVNIEEFIKIDERLPLFLGTMCGRLPYFEEIPGFFNGNKYIGVISKSLLSGGVFGLTVYYVPASTTFVDRNSSAGLEKIASYY
mgnify:CR=1 FL=1